MPKLNDLTGKVFDKLTVLEKAPSRARHVYWKCQCECGNVVEVSAESLKRNIPHDCGCVKLQLQKETKLDTLCIEDLMLETTQFRVV